MSKPTIIFAPGAFPCFDPFGPVISRLRMLHYPSIVVKFPKNANEVPLANYEAEVAAVRNAILAVVEQGNDAVLVMHSYGGIPGSQAVKGLGKEERMAEGEKGGVVHLLFVTSFVLDEGQSLSSLGGPPAPWMKVEGDYAIAVDPKNVFYNDIDDATAEEHARSIVPCPKHLSASTVEYAGWKTIPSSYLICTNDNALPPMAQEGMVAKAREVCPTAFKRVDRVHASHSVFMSKPVTVVECIRRAAGEEL